MNRIVCFILAALVFGIITLAQTRLTSLRGVDWTRENLTYLPSSDRIKPYLMGFESVYAEYLWIKTVLYFGSHSLTDKKYDYLITMIDNITRINPYFYPAYEFAGLIIPDICKNPSAAKIILERGLSHIGKTRWNLAFYMGVLYYKYYDDKVAAGLYYARASQVPGAPVKKLSELAAGMMTKAGNKREA